MTTSNYVQSDFSADDQIVELTEAQLEAVEGGGVAGVVGGMAIRYLIGRLFG